MKAYQLIVTQEAADEIELSYYYYEDQQQGLGERFKEKLDELLTLIQRNPEMFNERNQSLFSLSYQQKSG